MYNDEIIIVPQVPDYDEVVDRSGLITSTWSKWLSQLQQFILGFFPVYMVYDANEGRIPQVVFSPPSMSQAARDRLSSTTIIENSAIIFNTTSGKINYYQNGIWQELP